MSPETAPMVMRPPVRALTPAPGAAATALPLASAVKKAPKAMVPPTSTSVSPKSTTSTRSPIAAPPGQSVTPMMLSVDAVASATSPSLAPAFTCRRCGMAVVARKFLMIFMEGVSRSVSAW